MEDLQFPLDHDGLGVLINQLRAEGFDADFDLFQGWPFLYLGPKGLDPKQMPEGVRQLEFPLWEINAPENRSFVVNRQFHEMRKNRPDDFSFKKPYPGIL